LTKKIGPQRDSKTLATTKTKPKRARNYRKDEIKPHLDETPHVLNEGRQKQSMQREQAVKGYKVVID
jgi:hypothetical protein